MPIEAVNGSRERPMDEPENTEQLSPIIEHLAMQVARNKADVTKWGLNLVIFLFAILVTIIILTGLGIGIGIVAPLAISGLAMAWLLGWRKGRRLYQHFYTEELLDLREKPGKEAAASGVPISPREKQILSYVAQGQANKRIATELGISEQTVKNHVTSVLRTIVKYFLIFLDNMSTGCLKYIRKCHFKSSSSSASAEPLLGGFVTGGAWRRGY